MYNIIMLIEKYDKKLKKSLKGPLKDKKLLKNFEMEIQQLSQAENFFVYHNIPRPGPKRSHSLSNSCSYHYGVGLDHKHRIVLKPLPFKIDIKESKDVEIIECAFDYHKGGMKC